MSTERKEALDTLHRYFASKKTHAVLRATGASNQIIDAFVSRLMAQVSCDATAPMALCESFRTELQGLLKYVPLKLEFPRHIYLRGAKYRNDKTGKYSLTHYITKWGYIELANRNPNLHVNMPMLVREGDHFEYRMELNNKTGMFDTVLEFSPVMDDDYENKRILNGFVCYRQRISGSDWESGALVMSFKRMLKHRPARNAKMYDDWPDQMYAGVLIRGLKHVLPLESVPAELDDDLMEDDDEEEILEEEKPAPAKWRGRPRKEEPEPEPEEPDDEEEILEEEKPAPAKRRGRPRKEEPEPEPEEPDDEEGADMPEPVNPFNRKK